MSAPTDFLNITDLPEATSLNDIFFAGESSDQSEPTRKVSASKIPEFLSGSFTLQTDSVANMISGLTSDGTVIKHVIGQSWFISSKWVVKTVSIPMTISDFEQVGYANVRDFGITGNGTTDDSDAFIEMCKNPIRVRGNIGDVYLITKPIQDIESHSRILLDGTKVKWNGVAPSPVIISRDRGVFEVRGTVGNVIDSVATSVEWKEGTDKFPITVGSPVLSSEFVKITAGSLPNAYMSYLIRPSADQVDSDMIIADYNLGYTLSSPIFSYSAVTPKQDIVIRGFELEDLTNSPNDNEDISGVVLQYASNCHAVGIKAKSTNNPVVFGYYTSYCSVGDGYIDTPTKTTGGKGYYVQWNNALRCVSEGLNGKLARHISDFTTAAFCKVIDCGGENTKSGEFVTHGSYEHDLEFIRTRGFLGFAGSGESFGSSAKNITVRKHVGSDIRARANVENVHLIDCEANYVVLNVVDLIIESLKLYDTASKPGRLQINNWSRQLNKPHAITKPAVIKESNIKSGDTVYIFEQLLNQDEIIIENSTVYFRGQQDFGGGNLTFKHCDMESSANINEIALQKLHFIECDAVNLGFRFSSRTNPLDFKIKGGEWSGNNSSNQAFSFRDGSSIAGNKFALEGVDINWSGTDIIESPVSFFTNPNWDIKLITNEFSNGNVTLSATQFPMRSIGNTFSNGSSYTPSSLSNKRVSEHNIIGL